MHILIIDDDPLSLSGMKMALEQRGGHQCTALSDPETAIEVYRTGKFDVVISDVRMPKMSGIEVLNTLKEMNPAAKVILMTGFRTPELTEVLAAHGACAFFFKPLRADDLLNTLRRLESNPVR